MGGVSFIGKGVGTCKGADRLVPLLGRKSLLRKERNLHWWWGGGAGNTEISPSPVFFTASCVSFADGQVLRVPVGPAQIEVGPMVGGEMQRMLARAAPSLEPGTR